MVVVPFAPFEPDKARFNTSASPQTINAIPVADGWEPMPGLVSSEDDALPDPPMGAIFVKSPLGARRFFVGTSDKIYEYDFTTKAFSSVGSGYAVPQDGRWSFSIFGDNLYAQNGFDDEQFIDINVGTAFADNATAPSAKFVATVGDFLVRARKSDDPLALQWSALNDPTSNDAGLDGSDEQVIPDGNGINGIVPVSSGAVIFSRESMTLMAFALSSEFVFTFSPITKYRGCVAPYSICRIGQDDFVWYAADGFFRGAGQTPIGTEFVDEFILDETEESARFNMVGAPDYRRKIVWFRYQRNDGTYKLLGYKWVSGRWCFSDADVADLFRMETPAVTWDGLDALYATIDDVDVPFDSSLFKGGTEEFGAITPEGYFATFNGPPMAATLATNEISLNGVDRAFVNGGRLLGDPINFETVVFTSEYAGDILRELGAITPTSRTRNISLRANGRTHKFKVTIPEGETWSIVGGIDVSVAGAGKS